MSTRLVLFAVLTSLFFGCGDDDRRPARDTGTGNADASGDATTSDDAPSTVDVNLGDTMRPDSCQKMDILFVIDDSGSMSEEQANLVSNFPRFIEVLDAYRTDAGNPLDYRIGVTTTGRDITTVVTFTGFPIPPMTIMESGPFGALLQPSSCGMSRKWIESGDADVAGTFSCLANVGTSGSGTEMPLYMTEAALGPRVADGSNAGFLRNDALLAVIVLTDEDDCSRPEDRIEITIDASSPGGAAGAADACDPDGPTIVPIERVLSTLDGAKGERGRWAAAGIAGPGPGTCSSSFGDAAVASRLQDFVNRAGANAVFSSICDGDLAGSLMTALDTFDVACQNFPPLI